MNLVAAANCIEDEEKEEQKLSKKEKKERKIIEKTIEKEIDIANLDRKELMAKKIATVAENKELIAELNESEKMVIEMVGKTSSGDFFSVLNVTLILSRKQKNQD